MVNMGSRLTCRRWYAVGLVVALSFLPAPWNWGCAYGQGLFGVANPLVPFVYSPGLRGEARATAIWMGIASGQNTLPALNRTTWKLKDQFDMTKDNLFLDTMLKFSVGPFSVRGHYEQRYFKGQASAANIVRRTGLADATFEYSGIRVGGDVDVFLPFGIYAGANLDYDLYQPLFTEAVYSVQYGWRDDKQSGPVWVLGPGKKIEGEGALTLGAHIAANPIGSVYGVSGLFEIRARWPLSGTQVTDLEISGGVRAPETILGSVALKFGWRQTKIFFSDTQPHPDSGLGAYDSDFDAVLDGWFGQFSYYY